MSIRKLLEKVWAYFALAVLVLTAIAVMIVMGAPTVPAIIIGSVLFIGLAFVAPDVGLAVFSWIVDEAKKAARNATPNYAAAGSTNSFTIAADRHRRHFGDVDIAQTKGTAFSTGLDGIDGGGRTSARWAAGLITDHDTAINDTPARTHDLITV